MQYAASFVGWSNTGKTRLITRLVQIFASRGSHVGTLKKGHSPPSFETEGKDTDTFFQRGAEKVAYLSDHGGFFRFTTPPPLEEMLSYFSSCDVVLLEGIPLQGAPCFELINSPNQLSDTKYPPDKVSAYIAGDISESSDSSAVRPNDREKRPILPASKPEEIIKFLEELWNAK